MRERVQAGRCRVSAPEADAPRASMTRADGVDPSIRIPPPVAKSVWRRPQALAPSTRARRDHLSSSPKEGARWMQEEKVRGRGPVKKERWHLKRLWVHLSADSRTDQRRVDAD